MDVRIGHKEVWPPKNWSFWTVVLEKTLENPLDCKEIKSAIIKEINPKYSLEGVMLKLKLQYFGHLIRRADSLEKTLFWERLKAGGEWDDRGWDGWMVGWHHQLNGHEFEQALGVGEGQGILACCTGSQRVGHDWATDWTVPTSNLLSLMSQFPWLMKISGRIPLAMEFLLVDLSLGR